MVFGAFRARISSKRVLCLCQEETKGQIEKLKDAVARGNVAGLESELMEKAKQKAEAIRVAVAAREEEERKKKEAERLRPEDA